MTDEKPYGTQEERAAVIAGQQMDIDGDGDGRLDVRTRDYLYLEPGELRSAADAIENSEAEPETTPAERLEEAGIFSRGINDFEDIGGGAVYVECGAFTDDELDALHESDEWEFNGMHNKDGRIRIRVREVSE